MPSLFSKCLIKSVIQIEEEISMIISLIILNIETFVLLELLQNEK